MHVDMSVVCDIEVSVVPVSTADKVGLIMGHSCFSFGFLLLFPPNIRW